MRVVSCALFLMRCDCGFCVGVIGVLHLVWVGWRDSRVVPNCLCCGCLFVVMLLCGLVDVGGVCIWLLDCFGCVV